MRLGSLGAWASGGNDCFGYWACRDPLAPWHRAQLRSSDQQADALKRRARLSTGASREAPVDNECFSISHTEFHMQLRSSDQQAEALKRRARFVYRQLS